MARTSWLLCHENGICICYKTQYIIQYNTYTHKSVTLKSVYIIHTYITANIIITNNTIINLSLRFARQWCSISNCNWSILLSNPGMIFFALSETSGSTHWKKPHPPSAWKSPIIASKIRYLFLVLEHIWVLVVFKQDTISGLAAKWTTASPILTKYLWDEKPKYPKIQTTLRIGF